MIFTPYAALYTLTLMFPELFKIPFVDLTVKSYGLMMVIGFLSAVSLIRRLSRNITPDPQLITNAALYSLIAGVVGARLFYVVHYFSQFRGNLLSIFAIWHGGLELLGGVFLAIAVIAAYIRYHKLPMRQYLDILAVGLMLALVFGRVGCLLNGCCFGKPSSIPWTIRFPYGSLAYRSQVFPNLQRNRPLPQLMLPAEFFDYSDNAGIRYSDLKPFESLNIQQKEMVTNGHYRCLPVHPTQLYESAMAMLGCLILYLLWRSSQLRVNNPNTRFCKSGSTFGMMFIVYGTSRFFMEFLRDDNPLNKFDNLTISQHISLAMLVIGTVLIIVFRKMKPDRIVDKIRRNGSMD